MRIPAGRLCMLAVAAILAAAPAARAAEASEGMPLGPQYRLYDADVSELGIWDALTVEAWVRIDPVCPAGAVILDKLGPATGQGLRLETAANGKLRLITSAPSVVETNEGALATGRWTHIVAAFDPRQKIATLFIDGKPAASLSMDPAAKITLIGSQTPVRLGANQRGDHRFTGAISSLSLFDRALTADEVAALDTGKGPAPAARWRLAPDAPRRIEATSGRGALIAVPDLEGATTAPAGPLVLWYDHPAREWLESLAFGNGRLGGTLFGGVERERIELNEDTIWTGAPYDPANPDAPDAIRKARELLFAGKQKEAETLIESSAMGLPKTMAVYQTLGNLVLEFPESAEPVTHYRRSLDLDTAVATTTFSRAGVTYTREVFASAPDQVVVVRLTADKPASLTFAAHLATPFKDAKVAVTDGLLSLSGQGGSFNGKPGAIRFASLAQAKTQGGTVAPAGDTLRIENADAVTFLISCGTNYLNYHDLSAEASARAHHDLEAAAAKPYAELRSRHIADYQRLFHRVTLDVGTGPGGELPTDQRIRQFDGRDTSLAALYFQFGRYLLRHREKIT